ncbi:MAG: hypothetical protein BJ554DRAFT_360 [Olpidium bornovanus]|uniref:Uncharacterized protein n=1 Tax=Olpidium bornovanus TaxID=278681 RepID=A0A8H7ZU90_9FUNG|nr:MAG: hypothetical protein BJ554DRAFT_360 [Olpidium bornovanus]
MILNRLAPEDAPYVHTDEGAFRRGPGSAVVERN